MPTPYRFCLMDTAQPSPNLFHNSDSKPLNVMEEKQQAEFQSVRPKCLRYPPRHSPLHYLLLISLAVLQPLKWRPSTLLLLWTSLIYLLRSSKFIPS